MQNNISLTDAMSAASDTLKAKDKAAAVRDETLSKFTVAKQDYEAAQANLDAADTAHAEALEALENAARAGRSKKK